MIVGCARPACIDLFRHLQKSRIDETRHLPVARRAVRSLLSTMSPTVDAGGTSMEVEDHISPRQTPAPIHSAIESLESIKNGLESLDGRADPDAQATVTDFLEFTEHLPADITRSLTLIGKLDRDHIDASAHLHDLTYTWGQLPSLAADHRPAPVQLRADIADELGRVLTARVYSHAEAVRMAENSNRHLNRLKLIHAKLRSMFENYPAEDEANNRSPVATTRSPQATRVNKRYQGGDKGRRPRGPRITVPGEVLAPYEVGYDVFSGASDSSEDEVDEEPVARTARRRTPAPRGGSQKPRGRKPANEKPPKVPKLKISKAPGATQSQVPVPKIAVADSELLPGSAPLRPPSDDAVPGSEEAPWLQLTPYELAKLRKRMKKNAAWVPSDTMVNRELKLLGRGYDGWTAAKKKAEADGVPFDPVLPQPVIDEATGSEHLPMGAVSLDSAIAAEDKPLTNRGHELNKAKKMKKDRLSDQAAKEAEESTKRIAQLARSFQVPFQQSQPSSQSQAKNTKRQQKKRKRGSVAEADAEKPEPVTLKRSKTETPVPVPQHIALPRQTPIPPPQLTPGGTQIPLSTTPVPIPVPVHDQSILVGVKSSSGTSPAPSTDVGTTTTTVPTKSPADDSSTSPKKTVTPILPPVRETRAREAKTNQRAAVPPPIKTSGSRGNTPGAPTSGGESSASRRPPSRGGAQDSGPGLAAERPRRTSTARNTPAPEPSLRQPSKRTKRPAPGIISRTNSGGNNSAITKRKAAPKKSKRGAGAGSAQRKAEAEAEVEVDEDGNVIDPNEPRYCLCNRVSFGTMVMCESENVSQAWLLVLLHDQGTI